MFAAPFRNPKRAHSPGPPEPLSTEPVSTPKSVDTPEQGKASITYRFEGYIQKTVVTCHSVGFGAGTCTWTRAYIAY